MKTRIFRTNALALLLAAALCLAGCAGKSGDPLPSPSVYAPTEAPTSVPTAAPTEEPTPAPTDEPYEARVVREALERMSAKEKIGMLVMFGFTGRGQMDGEYAALGREYCVGNYIIGSVNVDKDAPDGGFEGVKELTSSIEMSDPLSTPRLFSTDVEGGTVVRFGFDPKLPSASELAERPPDEVRELFEYVGQKLCECGVNLDLAPVCDVAEEPDKTLLGSRIFSSDPELAARLCGAVSDGLHAGGCASCLKHFPGHGAVTGDSHTSVPETQKSAQELYEYDVEAFRLALSYSPDCVMAAHVLYPAFDEGNVASLSFSVLTGILRGDLGFEGVIISDDMLMAGLRESCPMDSAPLKFILAGGDVVLCGADPEVQRTVLETLTQAYEVRILTEERLNESAARILRLKLERGLWKPE